MDSRVTETQPQRGTPTPNIDNFISPKIQRWAALRPTAQILLDRPDVRDIGVLGPVVAAVAANA